MTRWTAKQKDKKLNLYQLRSDYSLILKKKFGYKLLIQSYSESNPSSVHSHRLLCEVRWSEALFPQWGKKKLFAIPSFCTMQRYPSLLLRHSLASPLNHSHFLSYHCYHKSSGNAFFSRSRALDLFLFFLSSARHAEKKGERCNNQRMLYRTEKQPMKFLYYVRSKIYTL